MTVTRHGGNPETDFWDSLEHTYPELFEKLYTIYDSGDDMHSGERKLIIFFEANGEDIMSIGWKEFYELIKENETLHDLWFL